MPAGFAPDAERRSAGPPFHLPSDVHRPVAGRAPRADERL